MKEKPINFSAEMARAVREGRKTQTLRPLMGQPKNGKISWEPEYLGGVFVSDWSWSAEGGQAWCLPYQPGDRLRVREPYWWESRMILEVESVSVMRVHEITEEEAIAEGVTLKSWVDIEGKQKSSYRAGFMFLWNQIYGLGAWMRNDWCFKITFRRLHEND